MRGNGSGAPLRSAGASACTWEPRQSSSTPYAAVQVTGAATSGKIAVAAVNAPVVPDGDVAGRSTEFTLVLDRSLDPQVEGRSLLRGKRIKVALPEAFTRTGNPITAPGSVILTKGWPQGGITLRIVLGGDAHRGVHRDR